ncbi:MAG: preprotein translocase subunit SecA [Parcubacteria group bacterium Licking1014_17]|nr:MAG: preprotein translocase subunit SecA [Parcubacteria group bacterium Licking1014_17]
MGIFGKIFGDQNEKTIERLRAVVGKINGLEEGIKKYSDSDLKSATATLKKRLAKGETLDDVLPEAFALVREAAKRTLGQRHFDVQLIGGMVLNEGRIAEMRTGEGKTLVATLPAYLNALTGNGVHIVTVNDYLSRRDAVWMGRIHNALGLSVGCLNHEASFVFDEKHISEKGGETTEEKSQASFKVEHEFLRPVTRRGAYEADITYGTNNEYGFDYLRDNMVYEPGHMVQAKGHNYAIVDEIDSILIDEARTPLIISAPDMESTKLYDTFTRVAANLTENEDYNVDEKLKAVSITEKGIEKVEKALGLKNIYEEGGVRYVHHLEQALKAEILFHRDKDYVVKDGEVIIVDEFTGRLMPGRRWSDGLHQAIEAKEGVYVQKESLTLASITFQNYFRLYKKLSGMTGTAQTSAEEFFKVYKLDVVTVPTNKQMIRADLPDRIYKTEKGKFQAIVKEIKEHNEKGQPVLIGTVSITKNEMLASFLEREGIKHELLNAKNHEREAEIIAQAGKPGAVTVATNMAGRGVDIILGGNPPDAGEAEKVKQAGGLHVIGTERHEARRIDNQLRGRSGRQGDPGSSQFFVSTDDEVVRIFGGDRLRRVMDTLGVGEEDVIENSFISRAIEQAQAKIEGHNFDARKYVLEYDDVMNKHRTAIYGLRWEVLTSDDVSEKIKEYIYGEIERLVNFHTRGEGTDWNVEELAEIAKEMLPVKGDVHGKLKEIAIDRDPAKIIDLLKSIADEARAEKIKEIGLSVQAGEESKNQFEKMLILRVVDELWVDHLDQMEGLRDSVRLRAYGQRDPLIEYKIEGQKLFTALQAAIATQIAHLYFKVSLMRQPKKVAIEEKRENISIPAGESSASELMKRESTPGAVKHESQKIGRNDPCPCGSGKKYKKCHGK